MQFFFSENKTITQEFNVSLGHNMGSGEPWLKQIHNNTVYSLATMLV